MMRIDNLKLINFRNFFSFSQLFGREDYTLRVNLAYESKSKLVFGYTYQSYSQEILNGLFDELGVRSEIVFDEGKNTFSFTLSIVFLIYNKKGVVGDVIFDAADEKCTAVPVESYKSFLTADVLRYIESLGLNGVFVFNGDTKNCHRVLFSHGHGVHTSGAVIKQLNREPIEKLGYMFMA